jgi:hypothetical protein
MSLQDSIQAITDWSEKNMSEVMAARRAALPT